MGPQPGILDPIQQPWRGDIVVCQQLQRDGLTFQAGNPAVVARQQDDAVRRQHRVPMPALASQLDSLQAVAVDIDTQPIGAGTTDPSQQLAEAIALWWGENGVERSGLVQVHPVSK